MSHPTKCKFGVNRNLSHKHDFNGFLDQARTNREKKSASWRELIPYITRSWTIFAMRCLCYAADRYRCADVWVSHIRIERFQQRISRAIDRFYFFSLCRVIARALTATSHQRVYTQRLQLNFHTNHTEKSEFLYHEFLWCFRQFMIISICCWVLGNAKINKYKKRQRN